jgi:hypothetical protein
MPYQGDNGVSQPLLQMCIGMASVLLTCAGLATGFFRSLNLAGARIERFGLPPRITWRNSALVFFALLTLAFPLCMLLRLTRAGWEIGSRADAFVSLGVCMVVAIAIAGYWQGSSASRPRSVVIAFLLTIMALGGFTIGWGPRLFKYPYKIVADEESIEPLGIGVAEWTRRWLGPGGRFSADRINSTLLVIYGRQAVITGALYKDNIPDVVFSKEFSPYELKIIKEAQVDYIMIDLRLTEDLPRYGVYFEPGEEAEFHILPPEPAALLKFNHVKGVSRPFDNGATIIYDVRRLHAVY